jgi:hypothetical protein
MANKTRNQRSWHRNTVPPSSHCNDLKTEDVQVFQSVSLLQVYIEEMSSDSSDLDSMKFSSAEQVEHRLSTPLVQTYLGKYLKYLCTGIVQQQRGPNIAREKPTVDVY